MRALAGNLSFDLVAARWPQRLPLVALCGTGRFELIAASFCELSWDEALDIRLEARPELVGAGPFTGGHIGFLSYDDLRQLFDPAAPRELAGLSSRIFAVTRVLVHDRLQGIWWEEGDEADGAEYELSAAELAELFRKPQVLAWPSLAGIELVPCAADAAYLAMVAEVLADIRAGRYYQLNLLRYFDVPQRVDRSWLLKRLGQCGEAFGCLMELPSQGEHPSVTIASFSPERFVKLAPRTDGTLLALTEPIKGTAARDSDACRDAALAAALLASAKDKAELAIIVDLMRNDLTRLALPGSVTVAKAAQLTTHQSVHHLSAEITAQLPSGIKLGEFLGALGPGGSITGAPKREVMRAIRQLEGRPRGAFMGHAFYLDRSGAFDSSVLIRTVLGRGEVLGDPTARAHWQFAAGSGLTIKSEPAAELAEITAKCAVVAAPSFVDPA